MPDAPAPVVRRGAVIVVPIDNNGLLGGLKFQTFSCFLFIFFLFCCCCCLFKVRVVVVSSTYSFSLSLPPSLTRSFDYNDGPARLLDIMRLSFLLSKNEFPPHYPVDRRETRLSFLFFLSLSLKYRHSWRQNFSLKLRSRLIPTQFRCIKVKPIKASVLSAA